MNTKNRLIEKLLEAAKKHKILTYPVLALVAVISVFHYFFSWSTGAGKRVVAVVMVLVMLVSQSYFLTSSATALVDTEETVQQQQELQAQSEEGLIDDSAASEENTSDGLVETETATEVTSEGGTEEFADETNNSSESTTTDVSASSEETSTEVEGDDTVNTEDSAYVEDDTSVSTEDVTEDVPVYSEDVDGPETDTVEEVKAAVKFIAITETGVVTEIFTGEAVKNTDSETYRIVTDSWEYMANTALATKVNDGVYLTYSGWYTSDDYSVKVNSEVAESLTLTEPGMIWLYAKGNVKNYKVSVGSEGVDTTYTVKGGTADGASTGVYAIAATLSGNSYSGAFTIEGAQRTGYKLVGIDREKSGAGVSASLNENGDLVVSLSGNVYKQHVQLAWEAEEYSISYATAEGGAGSVTQMVTYDGTDNSDLIYTDTKVKVADKEGYVFAGWETNNGAIKIPKEQFGSAFVSNVAGLQSYAYECWKSGTTAVLSPYYAYAGIDLLQKEITYEYKSTRTEPYIITAVYKNSGLGSDSFSYELGTIKDGNGVADLSKYGLNIEAGADAVTVSIDGELKGVVTLDVEVKVLDSRLKEGEAQPEPQHLKVVVTPCKLTLNTSEIKTLKKVYDGTTNCSFTGEIPTNIPNVFVVISESRFEAADAGEQNVILIRPASNWLKGDDAKNYVIAENAEGNLVVKGKIERRKVDVRTYAEMNGKDYVRAGEVNPVFKAEEISTDNADEGLIEADKNRLNELVTLMTEPERDDSVMTTSRDEVYRIVPADMKDSNYMFNFNLTNVGSFKVRLESADTLFKAIGKKESGWYGSDSKVVPKTDSGYNQICLEGGKTSSEIILTEELAKNENIKFQLRDSVTGAYTAYTTFPVKVDLTKPEYVGCEVVEDGVNAGGGLFFPSAGGQVTLGHYFNKSITFRVTYKDVASNPQKLVYSLSGNLTDTKGTNGQEIGYTSKNAEGEAVFTFTIPVKDLMDKKGGIQFYAIDGAENQSDLMNLVSEGDTWIVEKTAPEIDVVIKAGGTSSTDGITITGNDLETYYGNVKAYLSAEDYTSPITSITWIVNGEEYVQNLTEDKTKVNDTLAINADSFTPKEGGWFTVSAYVTDKAGNRSLESTPISFKVDDVKPEVTIDDGYDSYQQEVTLTFDAYDTLSGIRYINVKDAETGEMIQHVVKEVKQNEGGYMTSYCFVTTTEKGVYIIEVSDKAGNVYVSKNIVLDKVSNEAPECPAVTFTPEMNENGWITAEEVKTYITNVKKTVEDGTPVDTKYQLWKDGETSMHVTTIDSEKDAEELSLTSGVYQLKVWSESVTGVSCTLPEEGGHIYDIQVDSIAPIIEYELQKGSDNSLVVNFSVKDAISGVNGEKIQVFNGAYPVTAQITALEDGSGYTGSFNITEVGNYTIVAEDIAGNFAEAPAFRPMSMKVNAVKNISATAATVGAQVMKGTYDIKSASISYRKFDGVDYIESETLPILDEMTGNMSVSAVLDDLENGTNYVYKVTAISEGDEVLEYVGYFRSLADGEAGITVSGTTRYADGREAAITVGLFAGNSCIRAVEVDTSVSNTFTFNNVPDGNYSVVATDGVYTKTARVLIREGRILYPDTATLDLVLSGKNTSVEITTDETPDVTAGNLDTIFNDAMNYTNEDKTLVEDGIGTVEFKLYATLMKVSEVSAGEIAAMYSATSNKDKIVGAYLDLSLYKIVTDENGNMNRSQIHKLSGGANVSVTIPLGDLADKSGLEVIRIHQDGDTFTGAYLVDQDNNPATYTITTSQFSTYAVLYDPEKEPEKEPTTEEIKDGTLDPSDNGAINGTTENSGNEPGEDEPTTEKPNNNPNDEKEDGKKTASSGGSSVGSLRSSGSAKTGDATPIAMLFVIMSVSFGGFVILRRKLND